MNPFARLCALALVTCTGFAASANAAVIYSNTTPTGDTALPNSFKYTTPSSTYTSAFTKIQIQGYGSLDGQNAYEDDFSLSQNGNVIYRATFDLGGGGKNVVYQTPTGSSFVVTPTSTGNSTFNGGLANLLIPVTLASGANTFVLAYNSVAGGNQGIADEGFGINSFSVVSSVPLPASAPMFGAALVALGVVGYGLKRKGAVSAA